MKKGTWLQRVEVFGYWLFWLSRLDLNSRLSEKTKKGKPTKAAVNLAGFILDLEKFWKTGYA